MAQSTGREFMHKTRYEFLEESDQRKGIAQPPLELPYQGEAPLIELPAPDAVPVGEIDLTTAIRERQSMRRYTTEALSLGELSFLLWATQGVREIMQRPGRRATLRTVPSAGARHAFETYILANRVEDLAPGLYRFLAIEHKLAIVNTGPDIAEQVTTAALGQKFVRDNAATFIWTAVPYRMTWRYVERGYRFLHLDAGHVCQNLYLAAQAVDCGVCAIAAFNDKAMDAALGIDGETQFTIYMATVGKL